jgi:type I restriction enzyme S subunit
MKVLPEGWDTRTLKICLEKLKSGKYVERGWSPQCLSRPAQNAWGVLKTTSVQMGEFLPEYNKELPKSLEPKVGLEVNDGDFLVTTTGPRNRCGVVCRVRTTPRRLIFSGKILRFRADESQVLGPYLMYLLMSPDYQKELDGLKVGTSDSSVSIGNQQILDLEIPLASIEEQAKIVELLEEQLSRLDAVLGSVSAVRKKAARFRRSLLQAGFNGGLTGHDASTGITPDGWKTTTIAEVADFIRGVTYQKSDARKEPEEGFLPLIRATNIGNESLSYDEFVFVPKKVVKPEQLIRVNDMVIAASSGSISIVGKSAPVLMDFEATFGAFCAVLRPQSSISPDFFRLYVQSPICRETWSNLARGTNINNLKREQVLTTSIPLPPLGEQEKIAEILDQQISHLDAAFAVADAIEKNASAMRRSLLHAAFTGELTKQWREDAHV